MTDSTSKVRTTATRARQGRWGRHMIWVLLVSVVLAAGGMVAVWMWRSGDFNSAQHKTAPTPREAARFHTTAAPGS